MSQLIRHINARSKKANTAKVKVTAPSLFSIDEKPQEYVVYITAPGLQRKDISISLHQQQLTITAEKQQPLHCILPGTTENLSHWSNTLTLPIDADTLMTAAEYHNGELQIHIPKGTAGHTSSPVEVFVY
ncbi:MAG: Hsp20/alpha crystallin family protein [Chitinophagaceae bacterium]|nr:Hsp20/alpha crystallin family protein [Chitinophagaceae bacterium]